MKELFRCTKQMPPNKHSHPTPNCGAAAVNRYVLSECLRLDFQKLIAKFPWTFVGTLLMNVMTLTTLTYVAVSEGHSFDKAVEALPKALLIMNMASFMVFPCIDLFEGYKDRKMCKQLGAEYKNEFLLLFSEEEKENIRENFEKLQRLSGAKLKDLAIKGNK
jgi:hypothetical protein